MTNFVAIDAALSTPAEGKFCLCPVVLNGLGKIMETLPGLSVITSQPTSASIVGVVHPEGNRVAEKWLRANLFEIAQFCGAPSSPTYRAIFRILGENHPDDLLPIFGMADLKQALLVQYGIPLP